MPETKLKLLVQQHYKSSHPSVCKSFEIFSPSKTFTFYNFAGSQCYIMVNLNDDFHNQSEKDSSFAAIIRCNYDVLLKA